jgi:P27 family predicted phage terminase small subunit
MGRRGPKARDEETERLLGYPRKQAKKKKPAAKKKVVPITPAVATQISTPAAPSFLNTHGKKEWERLVPQLVADGKVSGIHATLLGAYCNYVGRAIACEEKIKRQTHTKGANNTYKQRPEVLEAARFWTQALTFWQKLGLDKKKPRAIDPPDEEDDDGGSTSDGDDGSGAPPPDPDYTLLYP